MLLQVSGASGLAPFQTYARYESRQETGLWLPGLGVGKVVVMGGAASCSNINHRHSSHLLNRPPAPSNRP